jgi:hypothetical protein
MMDMDRLLTIVMGGVPTEGDGGQERGASKEHFRPQRDSRRLTPASEDLAWPFTPRDTNGLH